MSHIDNLRTTPLITAANQAMRPLEEWTTRDKQVYCWPVPLEEVKTVEFLLKHGARVNAKDKARGATAMHYAAKNGDIKTAEVLLKYGANLNATSLAGETPLFWAARFNRLHFVVWLLNRKVNTQAQNATGRRAHQVADDEEMATLIENFKL
jgi:ankyrin repeat protein